MPDSNGRMDRIEAVLEAITQRLDRLTARHEALTQTVELLAIEGREHDKRIAHLGERITQLTDLMLTLTSVVRRHEERLEKLEGGDA